jgi:hypothetical protein
MDPEAGMVRPTLVSLLICDQVIDDRLTNKKSAIGLFNAVMVREFPASINQMVVLAAMTEIQGTVAITFRLVRDTDNAVVLEGTESVAAPNPLATIDLLFNLHGIRIPQAGQYGVELLSGGALLGRRRFQVLQQQRPGEGGEARTGEA